MQDLQKSEIRFNLTVLPLLLIDMLSTEGAKMPHIEPATLSSICITVQSVFP